MVTEKACKMRIGSPGKPVLCMHAPYRFSFTY